ncbi:VPS25 protein, partial [Pseudoatta argentina]
MELETKNKIIANYNMFFYATMCHVCKRFGDGVCLKKCGGCRMIAYCNRQHQKQHWSQHKSLCKAIQDVLQGFKMEDHGISEEWDDQKLNLILLISFKLGRPLEMYEKETFQFPRECIVCHEQDGQSLEDCQSCASISFCKDHKNSIKHKDTCVFLELCLRSNLLFINGENNTLDMHYLQYVFDTDIFRNMNDFINAYGNIQTESEMLYNILAARHLQYLTRPLTLFHTMQILDYIPQRKDLVIHVLAASYVEETTLMTWEILLLQPHADTRAKQIAAWKSLVLEYYRITKQAVVDVREIHTNPLFNNASINRKLPSEAVLVILEELGKSGNASPLDKTKQRWLVYWHTLEEWGDIIYNWAQENGFTGSVCTFFELTQGEDTNEQEFNGLDTEVLIRSLKTLEAARKAEIISFDDNQGVKFF